MSRRFGIWKTGGAQTATIAAPTPFTWAAGAASINVGTARDFVATNALTANSVLTLTGFSDGCFGQIVVQQDGTGNRTMSFTIAGRTIVRDLNVADDNPLMPVANAQTIYQYWFYTSPAGTPSVSIMKIFTQ